MNDIAKELVELLLEKGKTASTAESCTGGLIAKLITDIPGSSSAFHLGIVSYSNDIKADVLGVDSGVLETEGAVCEKTAVQMAEGARRLGKADYGVSTTGIAGPCGDGVCEEAGLMFIAVSDGENAAAQRLETHMNDRDYNRSFAAAMALRLLTEFIKNEQ